jgi:hypothetical protein
MISVRNETRKSVLAASADVANSIAIRRKNLLGRDELPPGHGL